MSTTRFARAAFTLAGLLAFTLWLPVAVVTYLPGWHEASCGWHERCERYGQVAATERIGELRHYMQHRADVLPPFNWTAKERSHLGEVRTMLDRCAVLALIGALLFFHADAQSRANAARHAMLGALACVVVLPFFGTFWREWFHPLLFANDNWKNYPQDTSWWIMPRVYFQYTTGLVIGVAVLACAALRYQALGELRVKKTGS